MYMDDKRKTNWSSIAIRWFSFLALFSPNYFSFYKLTKCLWRLPAQTLVGCTKFQAIISINVREIVYTKYKLYMHHYNLKRFQRYTYWHHKHYNEIWDGIFQGLQEALTMLIWINFHFQQGALSYSINLNMIHNFIYSCLRGHVDKLTGLFDKSFIWKEWLWPSLVHSALSINRERFFKRLSITDDRHKGMAKANTRPWINWTKKVYINTV